MLGGYLLTSDNQFGFNLNHVTGLCNRLLIIINVLCCSNNPEYQTCLLDVSKTFGPSAPTIVGRCANSFGYGIMFFSIVPNN